VVYATELRYGTAIFGVFILHHYAQPLLHLNQVDAKIKLS